MGWRYFLVWYSSFSVASAATLVIRGIHGPMNEAQLPSFGNKRQFQLNLPLISSAFTNGLEKVIDVLSNRNPITIEISTQERNPMFPQSPDPYEGNGMRFTRPYGNLPPNPPRRGPPPHSHGHNHHNNGHGPPRNQENVFNNNPNYFDDNVGHNPYLNGYDDRNTGIEDFYREPMNNHPGRKKPNGNNRPGYIDQPDYEYTTQNINLDDYMQQGRRKNPHGTEESNIVGYIDRFPVILLDENDIR